MSKTDLQKDMMNVINIHDSLLNSDIQTKLQ